MLRRGRKFCQILGRRLSYKCSFLCRWNNCGYRFIHVSLSSGCGLDFTQTHSWMIFVPCLWWWSYFLVYGCSRQGGTLVLRWDRSAKSMGDDLVNSRRSYSLLLRRGEMASPAEVEAEPPEPSELMKELLSWQERCGSATPECVGVGGRSGPCSRLLDLINFFSFRVIQFPRLWKDRYTRGKRNCNRMGHKHVEGGRAGLQHLAAKYLFFSGSWWKPKTELKNLWMWVQKTVC